MTTAEHERASIIFMAPSLFYTDPSDVLMKNKLHYDNAVLWHIISIYLCVWELLEYIYVLCLLTDYVLIEVGDFVL